MRFCYLFGLFIKFFCCFLVDGLLACWAAGLLGCWAAGLRRCWAAGPLGRWVAGLLGCSSAMLLCCWVCVWVFLLLGVGIVGWF